MFQRLICGAALVLSATLGAAGAARADMLPESALHGKKILFVDGEADAEKPSDDARVRAHLRDMGFAVTEARGDARPELNGVDLIVISATADPFRLDPAYRTTNVPIFTYNQMAYPDLGMTGSTAHSDFEIVSTDLPLMNGRMPATLYGYGANTTHDIARAVGLRDRMFGLYYLRMHTLGWGKPGNAATVIADTEGMPDHAALFAYEKGALLSNRESAPGRRVGFWINADGFHNLSQVSGPAANDPNVRDWNVGLRLFDASIRWAVSPPPPPTRLPPTLAKGKKVLFVGRTDGMEGAEADVHMVAHLRQMGFDVTWRDQSAREDGADAFDLIILSSPDSKWKLANKYLNTTASLLSLDGLLADAYRMTGRVRWAEYGEHGEEGEDDDLAANSIKIVNPLHPLAAGMSGVVQYLKEPAVVKWATPAHSATIIATLPDAPNQVAVFGYEKGATMDGYFVAPGRRAFFSLDNPDFDNLTPDGLALLDNTLLWMVR
jgi:hypothetical protein